MSRRAGGLFAGRGIALPGIRVTVIVIALAFVLGIGAGWLTAQVPDLYRAWTAPPEPSESPSPSASPTVEVSLPPLEPITRELGEDDAAAGIVSTLVRERGEGTFTPAPGVTPTVEDGGPVRYVRIDIEDGVTMDGDAVATYVMEALNDARGWGSAGRLQFVQTDGAADVRIVLASPYTAATLCREPHAAAVLDPGATASASPSPSASATVAPPCAVQGIVPISVYDWTAGLAPFESNVRGSRIYQLNHGVGHVLGEEDAACESGLAPVMTVQTELPEACRWNPWPYPEAAA